MQFTWLTNFDSVYVTAYLIKKGKLVIFLLNYQLNLTKCLNYLLTEALNRPLQIRRNLRLLLNRPRGNAMTALNDAEETLTQNTEKAGEVESFVETGQFKQAKQS